MSQNRLAMTITGLALAWALAGCGALDPEALKALAERRVNFTTWGIYCINQACGIGFLQYQRNPIENLEPAKPPTLSVSKP